MTTSLDEQHSQYIVPEGDLIPIVVTRHKHPLTAVRENEPIFMFDMHVELAKTWLKRLKHDIERAEKDGKEHISCWLTGEIYLPNTE